MVTVFEEGVKRNGWKMAVVESLIVGKDKQVRGANVGVITKGRATKFSVTPSFVLTHSSDSI